MSLRDEILALAGADKTKLADMTRKALQRVDEAMDAEKITHHVHQGKVVSESVDIDHRARMDGADRAFDLVGARVSKSATTQGSTAPPTVIIVMERAPEPQRVQAEVVDAVPVTPQ